MLTRVRSPSRLDLRDPNIRAFLFCDRPTGSALDVGSGNGCWNRRPRVECARVAGGHPVIDFCHVFRSDRIPLGNRRIHRHRSCLPQRKCNKDSGRTKVLPKASRTHSPGVEGARRNRLRTDAGRRTAANPSRYSRRTVVLACPTGCVTRLRTPATTINQNLAHYRPTVTTSLC